MDHFSRQILIALTAVTVAGALGCQRPAKPATVVPDAPVVSSFTASSTNVDANSEVTLSWKVENASSITLSEATSGKVDGVTDTAFESSVKVTVTRSSVFVLTARGEAGSDTRIVNVTVAGSAATVLFRALPGSVVGGESATLVWSAPGYGSVSIVDGDNQPVSLGSQGESGSVSVAPTKDTTYTLTAGQVTLTAEVKVSPNVVSFTSNKQVAGAGEKVTLSWSTAGATKVTLSAAGRGDLHTVTTGAELTEGSYEDTLPAGLPADGLMAYTLTAEAGSAASSKALIVYGGTGITVVAFNAPTIVRAASQSVVTWKTTAAELIEIQIDGVPLFQTATPAEVADGTFSFTAPGADFVITLKATNSRGGSAGRSATVEVLGVPANPTIAANPTSVAVGSPVTLTFTAPESRFTIIKDANNQVIFSARGPAAESGTATAYPSATTTYTVVADNTLGDPVATATTGTVTVTGTAGALAFTGGTPVSGVGAQISYPADPNAILYGLPHTNVLVGTNADFIDISTTGTKLNISNTADEGYDSFTPPFRTVIFGQPISGDVTVSSNGWMAFNKLGAALLTELTIPGNTVPPNMLAVYWDDLEFNGTTNAGAYWQVMGDAPARTLIVQWEGLREWQSTTGTGSVQARISETGEISFHYRNANIFSSSATVGIQGSVPTAGVSQPGLPASNTALYFFSPVASPVTTRVFSGVDYGASLKINNAYLKLKGPRAVRLPQEMSIVELNADPLASVANGEWLEIQNRTAWPMDLAGWSLTTPDAGSYTFNAGTVVPPRGFLVVGGSTDATQNDDAGVQVSWGASMSLPNRVGTVRLQYSPDAGTSLVYDAGSTALYDAGVSFMIDPGPYNFSDGGSLRSPVCLPTTVYGSSGQVGTPGAQNDCGFAYAMSSIPGGYYDISSTGTRVFNVATQVTDAVATAAIPVTANDPAPLYFGQPQSSVTISSNGWLSFTATTATASTNKTSPSAATATVPTATIAPFWDNLETVIGLTPASDVYYKRVAANEDPRNPAAHWIVQWHKFATESDDDDDLNFQVKFFDDGVIEYHYGAMGSGSSSYYANGTSATVWLENPTGTAALTASVNTSGVIAPFTAIRFTPR